MIVVDASVWVSAAMYDEMFHRGSLAWLQARERTGEVLAGPVIVLAEVGGAIARRSGNAQTADAAVSRITSLPGITLVSVDEGLARESARFAVDLGLRGADAVYVALASRLGCPLATWDDEMIRKTAGTIAAGQPSI